jgi:hypothetical protein
MSIFDELKIEYGRLNDPNYLKELIGRRQALYQPELQKTYGRLDADLNRRGLFSASPVTRARYRATGEFNRGIAESVEQEQTEKWKTIMPILAQMEMLERQGKLQNKAGWMKLIGTALGFGAGIALGPTKPWILGGGSNA